MAEPRGLFKVKSAGIAPVELAPVDRRSLELLPALRVIGVLRGKTVGLIGYGAVGRLVAHSLGAFGSRVVVYDPYLEGG